MFVGHGHAILIMIHTMYVPQLAGKANTRVYGSCLRYFEHETHSVYAPVGRQSKHTCDGSCLRYPEHEL